MSFFKLDRMHFVLFVSVLLSLALNILFYVSYNNLEKDSEETTTLYTSVENVTGKVRKCNIDVQMLSSIKSDGKKAQTSIFTVETGDTLSRIFAEAGVAMKDTALITQAINKVYKVSKLRVGNKIEITESEDDDENDNFYPPVEKVRLLSDTKEVVVTFDKHNNIYIASLNNLPLVTKHQFYAQNIEENVYKAASKAGIPANTIMHFINIFSYNFDFQREVRAGDKLEILYEYQETMDGKRVKESGNILYAALTVQGNKNKLYRFDVTDRKVDYISDDATSIKKTLLQTPINGARISSRYGMRHHPVLGYSRMHRGLDYAAPRGTPIFAAGDGVIEYVRVNNKGYGKYIKIKHNAKYSTLYAHMQGFARDMKKGKRVKQGDVVGYLGSTGLATGPHLHYEVHVNGRRVNPSKVKFSKEAPLSGSTLKRFAETKENVQKVINQFNSNS